MWKIVFFALLLFACSLLVFSLPPIFQDPRYHDFFGGRALVLSSFLLVPLGAWGWVEARGMRRRGEKILWEVFFVVVLLSGLASAYYHLQTTDLRLGFDRFLMSAVFMTFLAIIIYERVSALLGLWLAPVLIACGLASVAGWAYGLWDLRFYGLVQFFPLLGLPLFLLISPHVWKRDRWLFGSWLLYLLAKVFEISRGHLLKHFFVAGAALLLIFYIKSVKHGQRVTSR